jgi:hypothetical protein
MMVYQNLDAPPASCSPSACAASGGQCTVDVTYYHNDCGDTLGGCFTQAGLPANDTCQPIDTSSGTCPGAVVHAFSMANPQPIQGACTFSGGAAASTTTAWQTTATTCGPSGMTPGSCPASEICGPSPSAGALCIYQAGTPAACPPAPSPYSVLSVYYTGMTGDTRGCACNCGSPTTNCALGGTAVFYTDPGCGGESGSVGVSTASGSCAMLPGSSYYTTYGATLSQACNGTSVSPSGSPPAPSGPITFCCAL